MFKVNDVIGNREVTSLRLITFWGRSDEMEMRGEDEEIGTPNSPLCCNNPSNGESSTKLPNSDHPLLTIAADGRRDHTVPQLHFSHDHNQNHHHKLSLHQHIHKQHTRDHPEATPDPVQPFVVTASPSSDVTPIACSRSISRTPVADAMDISIPLSIIQYRECLKNHAASTGGHVLDGCGEFMPNGEDGTPEAFKCAACECHRNFHRKEMKHEWPSQQALPTGFFISNSVINNGHRSDRTPVPLSRHHQLPAVPISSMMMAFGGGSNGAPDESSSEDLNLYHPSDNGVRELFGQQTQLMKKRLRTKFTQGQKDKMVEFAEKLGWKIQKHDELELQQFCAEVGIRRQVFKVWMHNNKQTMKKKQV